MSGGMESGVRIGLFGGSFNPVHTGHLRAAEEIREHFTLDKVIFIPAHISPHKPAATLASAGHRLAMLECAIEHNRHFISWDVELKRPGKSYSVETLRHFREAFPEAAAPFFIMGIDAFREIGSWKNYRELFALCNFIVMTRPGYELPPAMELIPRQLAGAFSCNREEKRYRHASGCEVFIADIPGLAISSQDIRRRAAEGRSIAYLVPKAVEDYLRGHHLYQHREPVSGS
jgi:nicotinate-nucleotide adenylyltransferase